ncbi:AAA family ATPase [Streptomyces sp. NPDC002763]|uniref:helix-turn-helix transcriptional regulator n=1 Tax=Streptomyces sp. NPDC002763 TaxID=3154427 RepID=UPI003318EBE6
MLFGRHTETERIGRLVQDAREGRSRVLVLRGEAGIGKTALLRHGADAAREQGMRVLWLRGWAPERHLAFAGLSQLVRSDTRLIDRLPAAQAQALRGAVALGPTRPAADRFGVCAATLSLLAELAGERPLLVAVDDMHDVDPASAEALAFAARRLLAEDLGMLVTARPDPAVDSLTVALPVLEVTALAEPAVGELVADRTGVRPHKDVRHRLALGSAGNPMALIELVKGLTGPQLSGRDPLPRSLPARVAAAAGDALPGGREAPARDLRVAADALVGGAGPRAATAAGPGRAEFSGRVELFTGHPALARRFVFQAAEELCDTHPRRSSELFADAAMASLLSGDPAAAFDAAARAEKPSDGARPPAAPVTGLIRGITLLHLADGSGQLLGRRTVRTLLDRLRAAGALGMLPFALYVSSYADVFTGRTEAARATAAEAVELAASTGNEFWQYLSLSALAHVEAVRGKAELCREHGQRALALKRAGTDYPRDASEALGLLELSIGDYPEALRRFRGGAMSTPVAGPDGLLDGDFDAMEARIRSGLPLSEGARASLAEHAGQGRLPLRAAIALRLRGLAAGKGAEDCFEQALALHAEVPCPLETARTRLVYGERLRRAGRRARAREQLRSALDGFERVGAEVWAERCHRELTATGETVRARSAPPGAGDLTPQEFQVAQSVVRGATNKQAASALFLSPKTVEFHLGNVYRKLGVRNRTELSHRYPGLRD